MFQERFVNEIVPIRRARRFYYISENDARVYAGRHTDGKHEKLKDNKNGQPRPIRLCGINDPLGLAHFADSLKEIIQLIKW